MAKTWKRLLRFRCTCCGNCCREPIALVTDEDIRRIVRHTGRTAGNVVEFYTSDEIEWSLSNPGWIRLRNDQRIMGLRRNERGCRFLGRDDLCTIYEFRPVTCRRYPFNVEFDDRGGVEFLGISDAVECPYELDGENSLMQIKAVCDWEESEEQAYFKRLESWNRRERAGGTREFLRYLGFD